MKVEIEMEKRKKMNIKKGVTIQRRRRKATKEKVLLEKDLRSKRKEN